MKAYLYRRVFAALFIVVVGLTLLSVPQARAVVLYDNFTTSSLDPSNNRWNIDGQSRISDSFVLSQTSIVTGVNFAVWQEPGNPMVSVDYGITTVPSTYPVTGTALVTTTLTGATDGSLVGSIDSFSTVPTLLTAGTYYLVLQHAFGTGTPGIHWWWDESGGPSSATIFNGFGGGALASESFQVLGEPVATPLPAALPLFAGGLGVIGLLARRKKRKDAAALAAA